MSRNDLINKIYDSLQNKKYKSKFLKNKLGFDEDGYISKNIIGLEADQISTTIEGFLVENYQSQDIEKAKRIYEKAYNNILKFAREIVELKQYQLCPYCRANYISLVSLDNKRYLRPDLDHFYPKSKYFYLSVTLENLIPSCLLCNQRLKRNKIPQINFKQTQELFSKLKFQVDPVSKIISIANLSELNCHELAWLKQMGIQEIYSMHNEIFDNIYEKYEKYRKSNIKDMSNALILSEYEIKKLIFSEYNIMKENNEPLYKLKKDLFRQIVKI